jgi:hypothetical protein
VPASRAGADEKCPQRFLQQLPRVAVRCAGHGSGTNTTARGDAVERDLSRGRERRALAVPADSCDRLERSTRHCYQLGPVRGRVDAAHRAWLTYGPEVP